MSTFSDAFCDKMLIIIALVSNEKKILKRYDDARGNACRLILWRDDGFCAGAALICGWAGTADRKGPPGTLGWGWVWWSFRNPLRRTASWFGISPAKIGWRTSTPSGLKRKRTTTTWSHVAARGRFTSVGLTQFGTSVDHVGRVYFHVADIQFHADVLDAHVTLSVQFDGIASQQPRTGHVVCTQTHTKRKTVFTHFPVGPDVGCRRFGTYMTSRWTRLCPWSGSVRFSPRLWIFRSISLSACKSPLLIPIFPDLPRELWTNE